MKKSKLYYLAFFFISVFCTWLFTYRLGHGQFLYMGDQALRVSMAETSNYLFSLKRLVNLGDPNAWEFTTQFWDSLFFWAVYKIGISSTALVERLLFFLVLFGTLALSFTGLQKIARLTRSSTALDKIFFVTLWYTFNPFTLNLWHGGIYNIDTFLTYSLAPLSLYLIHRSLFGDSSTKERVLSVVLLFFQSFVFWLFAPFVFLTLIYICIYTALTKPPLLRLAKRAFILALYYLPLASVITFPVLYEYINSQSAANASLAPAFGNQQGGLWYQFLMLFSWGIYNVWTPRSLYPFYGYYFSPLYIGGTLLLYGLLFLKGVQHFEQKKLSVGTAVKKLLKEKFILIFSVIFFISLFLAKGAQWPLGEVFLFLYEHVPLFSVFRTPDIRFGFAIVICIAVLLTIVSEYYRRWLFGSAVLLIVLTQTLPFWTGWGIYGQNVGASFYDRVVTVPQDYWSVINFLNSDKGAFGYILPIPSNEYAIYSLPAGEHHIGQDLLSKYIAYPFIFLSEATGINTDTYDKVTRILRNGDYEKLRQLPIRFVLLRHDIVCEKCDTPNRALLKEYFPLVFENKTFSVFKVDGQPLIVSANTSFKKIEKMKYEVDLNNSATRKLVFLLSYDSNWKLFPKNEDNALGDLVYIWTKPVFEEAHKKTYGYANSWQINPSQLNSTKLVLYYRPQAYYWLSLYVSLATFLLYLSYLLFKTLHVDEARRRRVEDLTDTDPSYNHHLTYQMIRKYIKNKSLLDIGCWTGQYELLARHDARKIVGIDPGAEAINRAKNLFKNLGRITFNVGRAENLQFDNSSFDTVLFSEVLEHLPISSEQKAIREIKRVLKPNGVLILTTPYKHFLSILMDPAFFLLNHRHYSKEDVISLLETNGYTIKDVKILGGFANLIAGNVELLYKYILRKKFKPPRWLSQKIRDEWSDGFVRLLVLAQKKAKKI